MLSEVVMLNNIDKTSENSTYIISIQKILLIIFLAAAVTIFASQNAYAKVSLTAFPNSPDTDTQVWLNWSPVPGAEIYELYRSSGSGNILLATIDTDTALDPFNYLDTGLSPETSYTYTIRAYDRAHSGSPLDTATTSVKTTKIISPYNIKTVYDINRKTVLITWSNSTKATSCTVKCIKSDGSVSTYPADTLTSATIALSDGTPVQIKIEAAGEGGLKSDPSVPVMVTPVQPPQLTVTHESGKATVYWGEFPQIGQFQLERSRWNSVSSTWGAWSVASISLSGRSTDDIPDMSGRYRYRLAAKAGSSLSGYSSITEAVNITGTPSNLILSIENTNSIRLEWTNANGNELTPIIRRKVGSGTFVTISDSLGKDASTYTDNITIVSGETYTYWVGYEYEPGYFSSTTNSISALLPTAPASLYAGIFSPAEVALSWTDNSNNETGFRIERKTDSGNFEEIATVAANTTSYIDNTISGEHTYTYRVCAYNVLGNSAYTNEAAVNSGDMIAPVSLTATPVSANRIDLAWSYAGNSNHKTVIERKTAGGYWSVIYTTAMGVLNYSDTGLQADTVYHYRIRKYISPSVSGIPYPGNDSGVSAKTMLGSLSLSGHAASGNMIYLTWSGNTGGADVVVERKMSNGNFTPLTVVTPSTSGWYDDTGLIPGAFYTYRIKAKTGANESVYSNELTIQNFYLDAPTNLTVTKSSNSEIELSWNDNSDDETGFEIWRSVYGSGNYVLLATVGRNVTFYRDTSLEAGIQYYYMVRAFIAKDGIYSPYSNTISAGIGIVSPPENLHYTYISSDQVQLRWTDTSDNESGFRIERRIGQDGDWSVYAWVSSNTTSYTVSNLNTYTKYYFRVRAYRYDSNTSSLSNEIVVSTGKPTAPSSVEAKALSASKVKITWKDNSDNEMGFKILRKTSAAVYYTPLAEVRMNVTEYTDRSVKPGTKYYYKVVAYSDAGSAESTEAEVVTNIKVTFSDIRGVTWAQEAIESLAGTGVISGSNKLFRPNDNITRAEFVAMVVRAFKLNTVPVGSLADVRSDKWYYKEIMIAENFGIISGDSKNRFYPEALIMKEEIALILFKALELSGGEYMGHDNNVLEKYSDKNLISPNAIASMAALVGDGIIDGQTDSILGPKSSVTRAQAAVYLYNALSR